MERKVIVICSMVGFLGLLSAALGFAAEAKRVKNSQIRFSTRYNCIYPSSPALGLGLSAAAALVVAQVIISVATGCICCKRESHQSNSRWSLAFFCLAASWFTFVIAILLLLTGATLSNEHGGDSIYFGNYYCYASRRGVFAGAAVLSLASAALGITYYLSLSSTKNGSLSWGGPPPSQAGIAMGQQPAVPPPYNTQEPVFVHEDTYMRRQFT